MFRSVEEARSKACKRLPAAVFHYIDGGKEAEQATVANEAAFARHTFRPAAVPPRPLHRKSVRTCSAVPAGYRWPSRPRGSSGSFIRTVNWALRARRPGNRCRSSWARGPAFRRPMP